MKARRPFRIQKGCWYALCEPCRLAVRRYREILWGGLYEWMACDRCGAPADHEVYPMFAGRP